MEEKEDVVVSNIQDRAIAEEVQQSYLDYAMSVIVSRALPDVRDGLKPVHRRILYAMWSSGLRSTAKFRKSATVVGEVLGKYHPHGDSAVYDSMVRMAQDFSLRYPLIWGQGNFGSMDGDSPAAYRYTEAKLRPIAEEMLFDIEKETVDFVPNFDGVHEEPTVLPSKLPQLLLNGTVGIAVGMATNIPPHNLEELVDALIYLIDHSDATVDALMKYVHGPDFPTGGIIFNVKDIREAYATGRGKIVTRAKTDIIEVKEGVFHIIVTEMPYATNKADMLEKIALLVRDGKIQGIRDLRDESDKDGVRVVIELKKDAHPQKILNKLYATTDLQKNCNVNMLALVNGIEPQILNLKGILEYFLEHRIQVVERRARYDLRKAKEREHILEGLSKALDRINQVIETIKKSQTKETAHRNLCEKFGFSSLQATAILEMRLQTLAGLERKKIEDELLEKRKIIAYLEDLLAHRDKMFSVIKTELQEIKRKYGNGRKTTIVSSEVGEFRQEDVLPNEEAVISLTRGGYIKRTNPSHYRVQKRGGKGVIGAGTREDDVIMLFRAVMTHDDLFFFTNLGKVFQLKAYEIPESNRTARGNSAVNFLQLASDEKITEIIAFNKDDTYKFLYMATLRGVVKKTRIEEFLKVRRSGLFAIKLDPGDLLGWVKPTIGNDEVILVTKKGQSIRFKEGDVRPMGRMAAGVLGIRIKKDDVLVGMDIMPKEEKDRQLLVLSENGYGKRSVLKFYKVQRRGGSGIKTARITAKTGVLVWAKSVSSEDVKVEDMIVISAKGQVIRIPLKSVPLLNRDTQGVRVMRPKLGDRLSAATLL